VDAIGPRQIELKVHGLSKEDHGRVSARVFANKLKQLVSALEAADAVANGGIVHSYVLASMHMSEPTAVLAEIPIDEDGGDFGSAIPIFNDAIEGIKTHDSRIERLGSVVKKISLLTSGVESKFGFAELTTQHFNVVRIDDFLRRRAVQAKRDSGDKWFNGTAFGTFDGILKYVDLRGSLPQIKLTLTAGGKEIDCICRREDIETLGDTLSQRVRVYGRAIYTGTLPLPIRVEVTSVEPVKENADFSRWKGSFRPFAIESWDGDA
jgi:hypothetical protein